MGNAVYSKTVVSNAPKSGVFVCLSPKIALDNDNLALYLQGYFNTEVSLIVKNQEGQVLATKQQWIYADKITLSLSIKDYSTGWYTVQVVGREKVDNFTVWVQ